MRRAAVLGSSLAVSAALLWVLYGFLSRAPFDQRLAEAQERVRRGEWSAAKQALLRLHAEDPSHPEVIEALADVALQSGDPMQAIEWLRRVPSSVPERAARARYRAALLAMQLGHLAAIDALAQEAIELAPRYAEPRRLLLRRHFVVRQHRELMEQSVRLDELGQLSRSDLLRRCIAHRAYLDGAENVAWLELCLEKDPSSAAVRAALAHHWMSRDQNAQARRLLEHASTAAADDWPILLARSELEISEGRFEQAQQTVAQFPPQADAESRTWLARGTVWAAMGHGDAALTAFENASKLDPYDPAPGYAASRILRAQGDTAGAQRLLERSQQQRELLGLLSLLSEASAPGYQPLKPLDATERAACEAFRKLGFVREAEILAGNASPASKPLSLAALEELASPHNVPQLLAVAGSSTPVLQEAAPMGEVRFSDIAAKINLRFEYNSGRSPFRWLMETLGGGVAVLDFDLDGWDDLYLSQAGPLPLDPESSGAADRLFRNVQGRTALDVTRGAALADNAYGQGCAVGDYDNDGFADLVVCNYGELLVYKNQGDGTFQNAGPATGIASSKWGASAAFCDLDRDGDLDLYVVNYLNADFSLLRPCQFAGGYTSCRPFDYAGQEDTLWENLGEGQFADRTAEFGMNAPQGKGLGVVAVDFEGQGRDAVFVGNDTTPNFLFQRSADGRFQETAMLAGVAVNAQGLTEASMGIACGDVDGDGRFDLFVTTFQDETSTLFRCRGGGLFADETERAGLADSSRNRMGWGAQFLDVDCNGALDLFVANGMLHDTPQLPQMYYNSGSGRFREISHLAGGYFRLPRLGRSVACLDWNRDLRMDLVVTYQEGPVSLLENQSAVGNRIVLELTGVESNRDAVGTLIRAHIGDRVSHFYVTRNGGYFAANDPKVLIGCGDSAKIDRLEVIWPSGKSVVWSDMPVGGAYHVIEGTDQLWRREN
jgi:Tfp pilus assembly protein PilF